MTEKKIRCDACGATPAAEIRYDYKRVLDAAGGTDSEYNTVDLCIAHLTAQLQFALQQPPAAPNSSTKSDFSKWVRNYCTWKPRGEA